CDNNKRRGDRGGEGGGAGRGARPPLRRAGVGDVHKAQFPSLPPRHSVRSATQALWFPPKVGVPSIRPLGRRTSTSERRICEPAAVNCIGIPSSTKALC